ncbi:MAG: response regulator [Deltaproteobacteria bacterium]|nr:response regulator [Deltaproteobacteria bacterium]
MLLIEDDQTAQKLVAKHFEKLGLLVVTRDTGESALEWLKAGEPVDVVICDLGLPGISGAAVVEALRADEATAKVPIIVCSGRTSMQDHALALEAGADVFFEKPHRMKAIEEEVRRLLPEWHAEPSSPGTKRPSLIPTSVWKPK